MEDIGALIEKLQHTEEEKHNAAQRLEYIIEEAVKEMLGMLYELYPTLSRESIKVRSYSGSSFDIDEGIVLYSKGIDEKVVLNREKKLIHCKAAEDEISERQMSPKEFLTEIGFQKVYSNMKEIVREQIRINNEKTLSYRNEASKIQKHMAELHGGVHSLQEM